MSVTRLHACMATARMTSASSTVVNATKATRARTVNKTSMTAPLTHADCSILASTSTCRTSVTVLTATQAFIVKVLCYFYFFGNKKNKNRNRRRFVEKSW